MRIIQVLDYYASGNAVANCAVTYHRFSEKLGIESKIVARLIDKKEHFVTDLAYLDDLDKDDVIMYHLCIGTPLNIDICDYECNKVLVYHNITPPALIEKYNKGLAAACAEGLEQLVMMRPYFHLCLADSEFNKQDLIKAGYEENNIVVIPPFVSKDDFSNTPDATTVKKYDDGWTNILFVGRVSPNKKHEDLIRIFDYYKKNINPKSRLIMAGGIMEDYYNCLSEYVEELGTKDVIFTKQISFAQLLAFYKTARVFLCTSEHEGYCIPLIEAMIFGIPVIGYDAGAVGDTMGGSGVLLDNKSPVLVSKIIHELENDIDLRNRIIDRQNAYLQTLTEEELFKRYEEWIHQLPEAIDEVNHKEKQQEVVISDNANPYDVVLVIKASDWDTAKVNLGYIRENLNPKRIVVISSTKIRAYLRPEDNVVFINEDHLYAGMTFRKIKEFFVERGMAPSLTGWFLQQFLKLAYSYVCEDDYYLTWDADTIPLQPIDMINPDTHKPFFDMKPEYIEPYFNTIRNLLGMEKTEEESFIAEHMLFHVETVKDLLYKIEQRGCINGATFWEKILHASDFSVQGNAFSEFETYGTFCEYYYPDMYEKRHVETFRAGKMFLGENPSKEVLDWVSKNKKIVSFEQPQPIISKSQQLSINRRFRNKYTFDELVQRIYLSDTMNKSDYLETEHAALIMDYPWAECPAYCLTEDYKQRVVGRETKCNGSVLIYKPDAITCALGVWMGYHGVAVTLYDPDNMMKKTINENCYVGIKSMGCNMQFDILQDNVETRDVSEYNIVMVPNGNYEDALNKKVAYLANTNKTVVIGTGFDEKQSENILVDVATLSKEFLLTDKKDKVFVCADSIDAVDFLKTVMGNVLEIYRMDSKSTFMELSKRLSSYQKEKIDMETRLLDGCDREINRFLRNLK